MNALRNLWESCTEDLASALIAIACVIFAFGAIYSIAFLKFPSVTNDLKTATYYQDPRSKLCFLVMPHDIRRVINVPCTPEVLSLTKP